MQLRFISNFHDRGSPLAVSQFDDFSTLTNTSLQQNFAAYLGGDSAVTASIDFALAKPATMPLGFDSYGIVALNYVSSNGYRYYTFDTKVHYTIVGTPNRFGQWVYGDGSGVSAGIRVLDNTGEVSLNQFQVQHHCLLSMQMFQMVVNIDWTGWKFVVYKIENSGYWGGNGGTTGVPDYPLKWVSLFVSNNPSTAYTQYQSKIYISTLVAYSH